MNNETVSGNETKLVLKIDRVQKLDEGAFRCCATWGEGFTDMGHWMYINVTAGSHMCCSDVQQCACKQLFNHVCLLFPPLLDSCPNAETSLTQGFGLCWCLPLSSNYSGTGSLCKLKGQTSAAS